MRKIISILLCLSMLLSVTSVFAAEPISKVLDDTNIVNVTAKPLIIYQSGKPQTNENYTDDMKYIYKNGAFHELYQRL